MPQRQRSCTAIWHHPSLPVSIRKIIDRWPYDGTWRCTFWEIPVWFFAADSSVQVFKNRYHYRYHHYGAVPALYYITMQGLDKNTSCPMTRLGTKDSGKETAYSLLLLNRDTPSQLPVIMRGSFRWMLQIKRALQQVYLRGNINGRSTIIKWHECQYRPAGGLYQHVYTFSHFWCSAVKMMPDSIAEEGNVTVNGSSFSMAGWSTEKFNRIIRKWRPLRKQ